MREVNQIVSFVFDTEASMLASVGYVPGDLYKVAYIKSTKALKLLVDTATSTFIDVSPNMDSGGSGIPFVLVASGNITNTSGSVTTGTAFDYVLGPSYTFFPLGALRPGSPSGWYYTNWTSTSGGIVYADTYLSGVPEIPPNPTPLLTAVAAYTQTTGLDVYGPSYEIYPGLLGPNGFIEWNRVMNNSTNANSKSYTMYFGGVNFQGFAQTSNRYAAGQGTIKNRGRENAQVAASAAYGDNGTASSITKLSINTENIQILSFGLQIAVATDYAIIESHFMRATYVG